MKKTLTATTLLLLGAACGDENPDIVGPGPEFTLVWSDEFDVPDTPPTDVDGQDAWNLDDASWTHDVGGDGWGNEQLEFNTPRLQNSRIVRAEAGSDDGFLEIVAREESFGGNDYTSARIKTEDKIEFQYGRVEACIQLPTGQGIWPAFWMLGIGETTDWPFIGEIDIMENRGRDPKVVLASVHGPGYSGGDSITSRYRREEGTGFDAGFHVYRLDWDAGRIAFSVTPEPVDDCDDTSNLDFEVYHTVTPFTVGAGGDWVFTRPFYILLNIAVGGTFVLPPDASTTFPQSMLVDYVRVYERTR